MQPTSVLGDVRGFARDYALDRLPNGFVWDLVDYIPRRRGARLDGRGPWDFLTPKLSGQIDGGLHAPFRAGDTLLVHSSPNLFEISRTSGAGYMVGTLFPTMKQNGVMLRDRAYFADGTGASKPKYVTRAVASPPSEPTELGASAPNASLLCAYKDRLVTAGDPAEPQRVYFSPLETDGGPLGTWDATSIVDSSLAVTAIWPMAGQIMVFHDSSIEKIRGGIPPDVDITIDPDMYLDPLTEQMGCSDPASVVGWQENVIWAAARGVYLSDGATIRSLTDQGGISDVWRNLYNRKRVGTHVTSVVFLNYLFVSVLTDWDDSRPHDLRPFTLICDLGDRSWYRFANVAFTGAFPSASDGEEAWWSPDPYGHDAAYHNRIAELAPMLFTERDPVDLLDVGGHAFTPVNAVDGNGVPVLPQLETGWLRLGDEGLKRLRHVLVSHTTAQATQSNADLLEVSYKLRPWPYAPYTMLGSLPGEDDYKRHRLRLGRNGYGVAVKVQQIVPTYLSRLHDVAIDQWPQDRGKL